MWECIQNFPDWVDNEIDKNNKHSLRSNTKDYGGKTHETHGLRWDYSYSPVTTRGKKKGYGG
jgi:hypothetical protein